MKVTSDNVGDVCDKENSSVPEKNKKNNEKNNDFYGNGQKPMSPTSPKNNENQEESIKGFQMSSKGRIYEVSDKRYQELTGEDQIDITTTYYF